MARRFNDSDQVDAALECIKKTKDVMQLRHALAVVLPQCFGLTLEQTSQAIGLSTSWTSRMRNNFIARDDDELPKQGGRHRENFSAQREAQLLEPFLAKARNGEALVISQIKTVLEKALGKPIALASVYNMLHRNGWQK